MCGERFRDPPLCVCDRVSVGCEPYRRVCDQCTVCQRTSMLSGGKDSLKNREILSKMQMPKTGNHENEKKFPSTSPGSAFASKFSGPGVVFILSISCTLSFGNSRLSQPYYNLRNSIVIYNRISHTYFQKQKSRFLHEKIIFLIQKVLSLKV